MGVCEEKALEKVIIQVDKESSILSKVIIFIEMVDTTFIKGVLQKNFGSNTVKNYILLNFTNYFRKYKKTFGSGTDRDLVFTHTRKKKM